MDSKQENTLNTCESIIEGLTQSLALFEYQENNDSVTADSTNRKNILDKWNFQI
jgi:hypothetical protein